MRMAQKSILHEVDDCCQLSMQIEMHEEAIQCNQSEKKSKGNSKYSEDATSCNIEGLMHEVLARKIYLGRQFDTIRNEAADEDEKRNLCDSALPLETREVIGAQA